MKAEKRELIHPKRLELLDLEDQIHELKEELTILQRKERKQLNPNYKLSVTVHTNKEVSPSSDLTLGQEYLTIVGELTNQEVFDLHLNRFGSLNQPPEKIRKSVHYYLKFDFLIHGGGGWILLNDQQPCSRSEWESLKSNVIPAKFLKEKRQ